MNVNIVESIMAMDMLNGLPEGYDTLISPLDALNGEDEENIKFDYLNSRVLQEEQRIETNSGQETSKSEAAALL